MTEQTQSQLDTFREAARELETDDDLEHFEQGREKLAKQKPVEKAK